MRDRKNIMNSQKRFLGITGIRINEMVRSEEKRNSKNIIYKKDNKSITVCME